MKGRLLDMTGHARHRLMGIEQRIIGYVVIETVAVEQDNVGITPLVVGVAKAAIVRPRLGLATMIADLSLAIAPNLLVAIKTKPRL